MIGLAFTPEQFKTLLKMIYVANTVANGHREFEYVKEYDELEQYIFSRAKAAGFPGATWSHKADGDMDPTGSPREHHHPSSIFENDLELTRLMDDYDNAMLMPLLAEKLAERDIERTHGPAAKTALSEKDYDELFDLFADLYENEFEKFGFEQLVLAKVVQGAAEDAANNKKIS
ncbi:MAG: hypothetical protein AAB869_02670 [Patescibacteria group bacterium]